MEYAIIQVKPRKDYQNENSLELSDDKENPWKCTFTVTSRNSGFVQQNHYESAGFK